MRRCGFSINWSFRITLLTALFGTILGGVLAWPWPIGPLESSPESGLVAYFLKWHATARGSLKSGWGPNTDGSFQDVRDAHKAEMSGSAIVRFREKDGNLYYQDTRYLAVKVHEDFERWALQHSAHYGDCVTHVSEVLADQGKYSGIYVPNNQIPLSLMRNPYKQADGSVVFQQPLSGLTSMRFTAHWKSVLSGEVDPSWKHPSPNWCQGSDSREREERSFLANTVVRQEVGFKSTKDRSSFSVNTHFTYGPSPTGSSDVQWTAEAHLMGKCAEHDAPIPDGDPVVQNEDVNISSDDSEIPPDGSTKVHVRVTCDQVPIKDAEVELTIQPQERSGGHMHTEKRPRGKLNDTELTDTKPSITVKTDAKGDVTVKFEVPGKTASSKNVGIAGIYEVKATSKRFQDRTATVPISAGFRNLKSLLEDLGPTITMDSGTGTILGEYYDVNSATDAHPAGTFGTDGTLTAFRNLAKEFYQIQEIHNDELRKCNKAPWKLRKVSFNDIALPTGGLFDVKSTWATPHQTHGRGQGGDFNHFNETGKVSECDGSKVNFDDWLTTTLLEVGSRYGNWDQWDWNQPKHYLHLHVED